MSTENSYLEINRQSWNKRTEVHLKSDFYDLEGFLHGKSSLNPIELDLLGDVSGKSILHLQCHFGQDSISLARMGAEVSGVDLSDAAISEAKKLAVKTGTKAEFICCDIYDLPNHLEKQFDIVFTSYGTIGWLPDLDKWAKIVSRFLKPQGKFVFVEFHPVVWMFDDGFEKIAYDYFNTGAIIESSEGTYADRTADISQECVCWNHSLGEVFGSLIRNGLTLSSFEEFDYSPYDCFQDTVEFEAKKYRIKHISHLFPMVYALSARKSQALNS